MQKCSFESCVVCRKSIMCFQLQTAAIDETTVSSRRLQVVPETLDSISGVAEQAVEAPALAVEAAEAPGSAVEAAEAPALAVETAEAPGSAVEAPTQAVEAAAISSTLLTDHAVSPRDPIYPLSSLSLLQLRWRESHVTRLPRASQATRWRSRCVLQLRAGRAQQSRLYRTEKTACWFEHNPH
jgi:hypothetical protein